MKFSKTTIAVFLGAFLIAISSIAVVFAKSDNEEGEEVASSDCLLEKYIDPVVFAEAMADPTKFMEMMMIISNPQSVPGMMECSMDPETWNKVMVNYSNPAAMSAMMGQFMNPQTYLKWMVASMNPMFYQPFYAYMNPAYYTQWMAVSMNPETYQPMYKMMDPKWQQESATAMMSPNFFEQMFVGFQAPVVVETTPEE